MPNTAIPPTIAHALRRWARWGLVGLFTLASLWFVGWLGVPALLKWQLERLGSEQLGRPLTVERVTFHPWSLELTLEGLRLAQADRTSEQMFIQRVHVDAELQSLFRLAPVIDALTIEQPRLSLRHLGGGRLDIDDIIHKLSQPNDGSPPARFAVFNIALTGGSLDLTDDPVGQTHTVRQLNLNIPFLSNLGARRDVATQPKLAFELNGEAFNSQASTTPFATTHHTEATLDIPAFNLTHYQRYWPAQWPLQLRSGVLQAHLTFVFDQKDTPQLWVSGQLGLNQLQLQQTQAHTPRDTAQTASDENLLSWDRLSIAIDNAQPLQRQLNLSAVTLHHPTVTLRRDTRGTLNLQQLAQAFQTPSAPSATQARQAPPSMPWKVTLGQFQLTDGQAHWLDASTHPAAALSLDKLQLQTGPLAWPATAPAKLDGSAELGGAPLHWSGEVSERVADLALTLDQLPLSMAAPYLAQHLKPALTGTLNAKTQLHWAAAQGGQPGELAMRQTALDLNGITLGPRQQPLASLQRLQAEALDIDLAGTAPTVKLGNLVLERPQGQLQRDAQGRWMFEDWLQASPHTPTAAQSTARNATAPSPRIELAQVQIRNGQLLWADDVPASPVRLQVSGLQLQTGPLHLLAEQPQLAPLSLDLRVANTSPGNLRLEAARIRYQGQLRLPAPSHLPATAANALATQGELLLDHFPLQALKPYFADALNLQLQRADTSYRGSLKLALPPQGPDLTLQGQFALEDLRANTLQPAERLLSWKALNLRGLHLQLVGGQLRKLSVDDTVLNDYFARVIIGEDGRINLQDLTRKQSARVPDTSAPAPTQPKVTPDIRFGPIALVNGRVYFSDQFIQPHYSANLSELTGRLEAFSNTPPATGQAPTLAALSLRGRAEGTATLDITGQLNPLATPLALDIKGSARELELPPLSPYTVKYAGHGIERGKLSMDVSYRVEPNGQLTANHQIILNQLQFGNREEGSKAPNLPLKLAVALLADSDGVIDINLPVSGSINDPQFRIAPIIFKIIFNLIGKAITSPFALIAHALGDTASESNEITFAPGSAQLSDAARQRLDQVAQAMAKRPALQLTVTGQSDLDSERTGYQQARLEQLLRIEKRRQLARQGQQVDGRTQYTPEERPALLKELYRRTDMPKPRNLLGLAKDIPADDMEALLLASIQATPDALRELAVARGLAVKDHLAQSQVPLNRLFLGAPHADKHGKDWVPKSALTLSLP